LPTFDIPRDARFTCQQCAGCCQRWHVYLTAEEQERLMARDWAVDSPRLAGQKLFDEFPAPAGPGQRAVRLGKIQGSCVFLEPDNLCLIHKVLGMEAKPGPCQQYPFHFAGTPDGDVVVALDFACSSVLQDDGQSLTEQPSDVEGAYSAGRTRGEVLLQLGLPVGGVVGTDLELQPGQPLHWRNYRALEAALVGALLKPAAALEQRLLALDRLLVEAASRYGKSLASPNEDLERWTGQLRAEEYASLVNEAAAPAQSLMRQRAVLAPFLGSLEQQWQAWGTGKGGLGTRLTLAIIIVNGAGPLPLSSLEATVDQGQMARTRFAQDDPELSRLCTRYVKSLLERKSLVDSTDVFQGFRYLLLSFAAARWYAVARATLAGRAAASIEDLRLGIRVVEKGLGHAVGLRQGATQRIVRLLFSRIATPATMVHNFYN
jgi:Fe-S-cluster containining protein